MTKENKLYEVNGVLTYAHCFSARILAKSPKEAKKKIEESLDYYKDPANAEFQEGIVDLGVEIEEEKEE